MRMRITPSLRYSRSLYLLILAVFFIVSCKKEKSFESDIDTGLSGTAVFTLLPSGSDCSDASYTGNFIVGRATTMTELVMFTVNVTTPGTWTYKTPVVNGFSFVGAGVFDTPGDQLIALVANGTPGATGNTSFPLVVGSVSCSFDIPVQASDNDDIASGDLYYKAKIGGADYGESVTTTNDYIAATGIIGHSADASFSASIEPLTSPIPAGFTQLTIEKGLLSSYQTATTAQFKAFFAVGNAPYAPPGTNVYHNGNGVIIDWVDKAGVSWSSFHATNAQPAGSSFKIISVDELPVRDGVYRLKVKMEFSCTLYKANSTETAVLTNGEMVSIFGKQQ